MRFKKPVDSSSGTGKKSCGMRFIIFLIWIFAVWMILWNGLRIWPGEQIWAIAMVNYFAPWFALLLILLAIFAGLINERLLSGFLLVAFTLIVLHFIPYFAPPASVSNLDKPLKVMSFNVFQRNSDVEALIKIIHEHDPDIVALQEVTPEIGDQLVSQLSDRYSYHTLDLLGDEMGQGLMSRYPIQQLSAMPDYHFQTAIVDTPLESIRIFNIHSPTLFPFSWKEHWQIQKSFFEGILAEINKVDGPKIVLGDFNTTPLTELHTLLTGDLSDTHIESGWGFGFSYPARPKLGIRLPTPLLRIDYILISEHFTSANTQVLKESGDSDHRPVKTELFLNQ